MGIRIKRHGAGFFAKIEVAGVMMSGKQKS